MLACIRSWFVTKPKSLEDRVARLLNKYEVVEYSELMSICCTKWRLRNTISKLKAKGMNIINFQKPKPAGNHFCGSTSIYQLLK